MLKIWCINITVVLSRYIKAEDGYVIACQSCEFIESLGCEIIERISGLPQWAKCSEETLTIIKLTYPNIVVASFDPARYYEIIDKIILPDMGNSPGQLTKASILSLHCKDFLDD